MNGTGSRPPGCRRATVSAAMNISAANRLSSGRARSMRLGSASRYTVPPLSMIVGHVEPVGVVGGGGAEGAAVGGGDGVEREGEVAQDAAGGLGGPGVEVGGEVEDGGGVGVVGVVFQDPGGGGVVGVPHPVQEVVDAAVAECGGVQPGGEDLGGGAAEEPVGVGAAVAGGVDAGDERSGAAVRDGVVQRRRGSGSTAPGGIRPPTGWRGRRSRRPRPGTAAPDRPAGR